MRKPINLAICLLPLLFACTTGNHSPLPVGEIVNMPQQEWPEIAAEFKSRNQGDRAETRRWRLWRQPRRVEIETLGAGLGESWQRDGNSLIKRLLFHRDRAVIEYQDDDLRLLTEARSWRKLQLMVAPELLNRLSSGELDNSQGFPLRDYFGAVGDSEWRISMRLDVGLPIRIERRQHGINEITELTEIYPLTAAPWQPSDSNGYRIIEFADMGDREHDPLVMKLQSQLGQAHHRHSIGEQAD